MLSMLRCCTSRTTCFIQTKIVTRRYMTISEKMETLLKKQDHIPHHYKLIYREKNDTFAGLMYHSLNFLSYMTVAVLGCKWYTDTPISENAKHFSLSYKSIDSVILAIGIISIFYISYWTRQRFVLRVWYSEEAQNYRAIFIGRVPFLYEYKELPAKSITFATPKDSAFPWRNVIFNAHGRKIYLFQDNFRTHSDCLKMLKPGEEFKPDPA